MTVHIFISGKVQGIGYRQFVKSNARSLNVTGWVKNTDDGRVEAVFSGLKTAINEMLKRCKKGPFLAEVKNINVEQQKEDEVFSDFEIR